MGKLLEEGDDNQGFESNTHSLISTGYSRKWTANRFVVKSYNDAALTDLQCRSRT
jgi:hypothetical protein